MYTIIYFSPTGKILHLAKIMADGLSVPKEDVLPLEFTDPSLLGRNNQLVLLFPVHGFNAPRTVKRFVRSMPLTFIMNFLGKIESPAARLFGLELHANKNCTSCGTCWTNCPQKNKSQKSNGKPRFGFNCIMCMRCTYQCPEKAISPRVSKFIPIKGGYQLSNYIKE